MHHHHGADGQTGTSCRAFAGPNGGEIGLSSMTESHDGSEIHDLGRVALLMIDYQVGLCIRGPACVAPALADQVEARGVLRAAAGVLGAARHAGVLVVHVRLAFDSGYVLRTNRTPRFDRYPAERLLQYSDEGAQLIPELRPDGEPVITKGCINPFIGTPLLSALTGRGIETVVLGGVATNLAVESAARHAADCGLLPVVVEDMCASMRPDLHDFAAEHTLPMFASVVSSHSISSTFA